MKQKFVFGLHVISIIALLFAISSTLVLAANNPGHDSLYVLKIGDNITGNLNVTGTFNAYSLQTATLLYGSQLNIQANGTLIAVGSVPTIQSAGNNLYLDSASGDIRVATQAGTSNYVRIGTGSINVIVNGTLKQYDQLLCMQNGSNCPTALGGANISGSGTANNITKWTSGTAIGNSIVYDSGTNIGIGTSSPNSKLEVTGNISASGNVYESGGNRVCTVANGLCSGTVNYQSSAAGWTNTTTQIWLSNNATNVSIGYIGTYPAFFVDTAKGRVSINTTASTSTLNVGGGVNIDANGANTGYRVAGSRVIYDDAAGTYVGNLDTSRKLLLVAGQATRITVDTIGKVGISTTAPTQVLDVNGSANFSGTDAVVYINGSIACTAANGLCAAAVPYQSSAAGWINTTTTTSTALNVNLTTGNLTVIAGNVGIGTAAPSTMLDVNGTITGTTLQALPSAASANAVMYLYGKNAGTVNTAQILANWNGGIAIIPSLADSTVSIYHYNTSPDNVTGKTARLNFELYNTDASRVIFGYVGAITTNVTNQGNSSGDLQLATRLNNTLSEKMRITGTGNVGIGTTTPTQKLEVSGNGNFSGTNAVLYVNGSTVCTVANGLCANGSYVSGSAGWTNTTTVTSTALNVNITTGNLTVISGNVGIGTSAPLMKLDVRGSLNSGSGAVGIAIDENVGYGFRRSSDNYIVPIIATGGSSGSRTIIVGSNSGEYSTNSYFGIIFSGGERMRINHAGNVGIATTGPTATLHINSSNYNGSLHIQNTTGSPHLFINGSSGNVGIGTTGPNQKLDVNGSINATTYYGAGTGLTGTASGLTSGLATAIAGGSAGAILFQSGAGVTASNSAKFYWDNTNYHLGIGTGAPLAGVHINDSGAGGSLLIENTTGGTQLFVNGTNGYVGIGTLNTTERLTIGGNSTSSLGLRPTDSPSGYGVVINATYAAAHSFSITTYPNSVERIGLYTTHLILQPASDNVGIGITTPSEKLTVNGNLSATNVYVTNLNATTLMYEAGSRVCTAANGLCNLSLSTIATNMGNYSAGISGAVGQNLTYALINTNMGNASKYVANCGVNTVIQNITATGIQCVADQSGSGVTGNGASGNITMWTGSTSLGNTSMYFTSGKVGIGTSTPTHTLNVVGDINTTGNLYIKGNVTGYDLAEFISGDGNLEAGDVVEIDTTRDEAIIKSKSAYSTKVAGIVSTNPGLKMNLDDNLKNKVPLALSGRVPVKVNNENGPIARGDLLTTSSTPGYAMKCPDRLTCSGAILGKAMQEHTATQPGKIIALVTLG